MKGAEVAVTDPIDSVCGEDTRPAVKDLIAKHRKNIDKLKAAIREDALYD